MTNRPMPLDSRGGESIFIARNSFKAHDFGLVSLAWPKSLLFTWTFRIIVLFMQISKISRRIMNLENPCRKPIFSCQHFFQRPHCCTWSSAVSIRSYITSVWVPFQRLHSNIVFLMAWLFSGVTPSPFLFPYSLINLEPFSTLPYHLSSRQISCLLTL